jgi:hypothetical protein
MKFQSSNEVKDSSLRFLPYHQRRHAGEERCIIPVVMRQTTETIQIAHMRNGDSEVSMCGLRLLVNMVKLHSSVVKLKMKEFRSLELGPRKTSALLGKLSVRAGVPPISPHSLEKRSRRWIVAKMTAQVMYVTICFEVAGDGFLGLRIVGP